MYGLRSYLNFGDTHVTNFNAVLDIAQHLHNTAVIAVSFCNNHTLGQKSI